MNNTIPQIGSDGLATSKFVELGGDAVNGIAYATHFSVATSKDIPAAQRFVAAFQSGYGVPPVAANAEGYDAAMIGIEAIERAGSDDPTAIRDALRCARRITPAFAARSNSTPRAILSCRRTWRAFWTGRRSMRATRCRISRCGDG